MTQCGAAGPAACVARAWRRQTRSKTGGMACTSASQYGQTRHCGSMGLRQDGHEVRRRRAHVGHTR